VLGDECDASFFAGRAADRFSKAYCGKAVELADAATAWLNVRGDRLKVGGAIEFWSKLTGEIA